MLYNSLNLAVSKISNNSNIHPERAGVLFTPNKTVATDGFRLLEVSTPATGNSEDYLLVNGGIVLKDQESFIVNAKAIKAIKIPKNKTISALNHVAIKSISPNAIEFATNDLTNKQIYSIPRIDGVFPDYESIFPAGDPIAEVTLNGLYLAELLEIMASSSSLSKVTMRLYGKDKPISLISSNDKQKIRGLLMPIHD